MKQTVIALLAVLIFFSCAVQKRKYQKGYHISWKRSAAVQHDSHKRLALHEQSAKQSVHVKKVEPVHQQEIVRQLSAINAPRQALQDSREKAVTVKDEPCDELIFRDGREVKGKVTEITQTEIKYKKCGMPDGPTYVVKKSEMTLIKYANGTRETAGCLNLLDLHRSKSLCRGCAGVGHCRFYYALLRHHLRHPGHCIRR